MFALAKGSDDIAFQIDPPSLDKIRKKNTLLIIKADYKKDDPPITDDTVDQQVIMMEMSRNLLETLYL